MFAFNLWNIIYFYGTRGYFLFFLKNNFIFQISYIDYYKKMYDIDIKNKNQPMLITKAKKKDIKNTSKVCN